MTLSGKIAVVALSLSALFSMHVSQAQSLSDKQEKSPPATSRVTVASEGSLPAAVNSREQTHSPALSADSTSRQHISDEAVSNRGYIDFTEAAMRWSKKATLLQTKGYPKVELNLLFMDLNLFLKELDKSYFTSTTPVSGVNSSSYQFALENEQQWQSYIKLLDLRAELLNHFPPAEYQRVMSFGPQGIKQLLLDVKLLQMHVQLFFLIDRYRAEYFIKDMLLSPVPLLGSVVQLCLLLLLFFYWQRRGLRVVTLSITRLLNDSGQPSLAKHIIVSVGQFYLYIHRRVEYGLLFFCLLSIFLAMIDSAHRGIILDVFMPIWLVSVLLRVRDYCVLYSEKTLKQLVQGSVSCVLTLLLIYAIGDVLLQEFHLRKTVMAHDLCMILLVSTAALFVWWMFKWRLFIFKCIASETYANNRLLPFVENNSSGLRSVLLVCIAIIYLPALSLLRASVKKASRYETVNLWLTYLFRVEVARQHAKTVEQTPLSLYPDSECADFLPEYYPPQVMDNIATALQQRIEELAISAKASTCLIHASKGAGKTVFLKQLVEHSAALEEQGFKRLYVSCPRGGFSSLMESLALHMALDENVAEGEELNSARAVVSALKDMDKTLICIDDVHHLVTPSIGGLQELDRLVRMMRRSSRNIAWLISMDSACWRFVERARGERFLFDLEEALPKWTDKEISALIQRRVDSNGLSLDLSHFVFPKQLSQADDEEEAAVFRYSRILWEYAAGNPGVALQLWRQSLFVDNSGVSESVDKRAILRLFDLSENAELEALSVSMLLILRAIIQMEFAEKDAIAQCANMSSDEVIDALRLLRSKGFIVRNDRNEYAIHWPSYRDIVMVLSRQHLLVL